MLLAGLSEQNKSNFFLRVTLILLNPVPIGVVIGPFKAILFLLIDSITLSGRGVPSFSIQSLPAFCISQLISRLQTESTDKTASVISGPIPSPGINVILCIKIFSYVLIAF